ncbi:L-rhamnose mutarotase, partial [candidate division KSB1 bacterium]|nr:L-rhamnose mutarotase [candidate division KSB1 bacterium]
GMEPVTQRFGSLIQVLPEYEERYTILHKHVFPGVLNAIRRANIRNYSIFLHQGLLFSYSEYVGHDLQADVEINRADEISQEWWKLTDPMQEPLPTRQPGEWWASADELFYLQSEGPAAAQLQRLAFAIGIAANQIDACRQRYSDAPQELISALEKIPLNKIAVYHHHDRLYAYVEYSGKDFYADIEKALQYPIVNRWWQKTLELQCSPSGEQPATWEPMRSVFYLE